MFHFKPEVYSTGAPVWRFIPGGVTSLLRFYIYIVLGVPWLNPSPSRVVTGTLFSEPMRVETIRERGSGTWVVGLLGLNSERFGKVTLYSRFRRSAAAASPEVGQRSTTASIRSAWFCVTDHDFIQFSAVIGPKSDPSFSIEA